jgi:hypothetical protein
MPIYSHVVPFDGSQVQTENVVPAQRRYIVIVCEPATQQYVDEPRA